jgi:16S rRNA (guanine527-N7)-methyltransferase
MEVDIETLIAQGSKLLNIELSVEQVSTLTELVKLLDKWNKVHNLTAIRSQLQIAKKHILDSLSIGKYIKSNNMLDVGSGAGFPGIVLAILFPHKNITTLDANSKKTRFMLQAKIDLKINNLNIVCSRVENYHPDTHFDIITSRAFTSIARTLELTGHLLSKSGCYLIMKGTFPEKELEDITQNAKFVLSRCDNLQVPYVNEQRHLVIINHQS